MAKAKPKQDILDDLFGAGEEKPRRRRVAAPAVPTAGPSGPAMSGGPAAKPAAPTTRRKRLNKDEMKALYG